MVNNIIKSIIGIFSIFTSTLLGKYILIFIISLIPILELRGGLIAASLLDLPMWTSLLICLLGNAIIIPFVLFLMDGIIKLLSHIKIFKKFFDWWTNKALKKKNVIEKYGYIGIMLFVAIPLPGSGAWTGCLLSVLLGLDKKKSFIAASIGLLIAAIIMLIFSYGLLKGIVK